MKKILVMCFLCLLSTVLFINNASAFANRETMEKYFPGEFLDNIDQEKYNQLASLDYDNAITKEVIIPNTDYESDISPISGEPTRGNTYSTNYKTLTLNAIPYSNSLNYEVTLTLNWKILPSTRSYDVIALRFVNMPMYNGSQYGLQAYTGGNVGYVYNGTNMNLKSNGFGISMNLINGSTNSLQCMIGVTATKGTGAAIYGAYEHAISNISLANSKKYTLSNVGMGNVINFDSSVWNYYDDMNGVNMSL